MSRNYEYFDKKAVQMKDGRIHLGMLAFVTPFRPIEETFNGEKVWSLVYEDVNVNHNKLNPFMSYEICNHTETLAVNNQANHATGHKVDLSKEIQLVFWNHNKVSLNLYKANYFM